MFYFWIVNTKETSVLSEGWTGEQVALLECEIKTSLLRQNMHHHGQLVLL